MLVITRSKSKRRLSSIPEDVELHPSKTSSPNDLLQNLTVYPKHRQRKPKRQSKHQSRRQPRKQPHKYQDSNQEKPPGGITKIHSPNLPSTTITHWPCHHCDCPQGVFELLVSICVNCGHEMDNHSLPGLSPWNPNCPYVCERQDLVSSVLQHALDMRVVIIRATPLVGKTTLLQLLGYHILFQKKELEPVFIQWEPRNKRNSLPYRQYLEEKEAWARNYNAKYRPHNLNARTVFLIDEAQGSYEDEEFWSIELKNRNTRTKPIFVLVCLYGAAGISKIQDPYIESQASKVDTLNRIELRPSKYNSLCMLFKPEETLTAVSKWILENHLNPESVDRVAMAEYIHSATDGHPGMVGTILGCFELLIAQNIQNAQRWSPAFCHEVLVEHNFLLDFLTRWGRGLWTAQGENYLKRALINHPSYSQLKYSDIADAMRKVAILPRGYTEPRSDNLNALAFCYKMGFLYAEQSRPGSSDITYVFASPIHRRIAYRRLIPGPPPETSLDKITLQQACLNAIERFSPSVLHHSSPSNCSGQSNNNWSIPEAAFQDEMYCCLSYELHNLPVLTEYAHTKDGRIDFYLFGKKWGLEILQSGNNGRLEEHANRFQPGGKYHKWGILEDYIILNFCSKSSIDSLKVKDLDIQSHILHIIIDTNECTAEVYTYDKQLQATLNLGEGRQRSYSAEQGSASEDLDISMRDWKIEKQEMARTISQLQRQLSQR